MFILRGWINRLTFYGVGFHAFLNNDRKIAFTRKGRMADFDIRRAELVECPTSDSRNWFLQNSKICGVHSARFMTTSPLVASFPEEFRTVSFEELKTGAHLDRRVYKDAVPVASSFGVVSAILRQKCPKPNERGAYSWLVDLINSLKIESRPDLKTSKTIDRKDETTLQTCVDSSDITLIVQNIQEENRSEDRS